MKKWNYNTIKEFVEKDNIFNVINIENAENIHKAHVFYKCTRCGYDNDMKFNNFKNRDTKCKFCDSQKFMNMEKFLNKFSKREDFNEYIFLEDFQKSSIPFKVKHTKCGYEYLVRPNDLLHNNARCPKCSNHIKYTFLTLSEAIVKTDENYELMEIISDNICVKSKVKLKHKICGKEFEIIAHNFLHNNQRCRCTIIPKLQNLLCNKSSKMSYGASIIHQYLLSNNITFELEKTFNWLVYKRKLKIDFFCSEYNLAIEYDGKQHFTTNKSNKIFTEENLKLLRDRDNVKDKLLKEHGISLLRISYLDDEATIIQKLNNIFKNSTTK